MFQYPKGDGIGASFDRLRQNTDEFLSPISGRQVFRARHGLKNGPGDFLEAFISFQVTVLIIVEFKMINID